MVVLGTAVAVIAQLVSPRTNIPDILRNTELVLVSQLLTYSVVFAVMFAQVRGRAGAFWQPLRWNWPRAWISYVLLGAIVYFALIAIAQVLPIPKHLPIDRFFGNAREAALMSLFAVSLAPLMEELFFRGFLYPVLVRWLGDKFVDPLALRTAGLFFLVAAAWANVVHLAAFPLNAFLIALPFLATFITVIMRAMSAPPQHLERVLLPGGFVCGSAFIGMAGKVAFFCLIGFLLITAAALLWRGYANAMPVHRARRTGLICALFLTSAAFAVLHGAQLKYSWAVLIIFLVGVALTTVRAITKSVAASFLLHVGYNGTLSLLMFIVTGGFRHLEKLNQ